MTFMERIQEVLHGDASMNCSLCKYRSNLLGFESEVGLIQESHHHHVEGLTESCSLCEGECTGECQSDSEHEHEHEHHLYPHGNHPFGPVTLRLPKSHKS